MGESPRWHDGRLWLSDWGAGEILALDAAGEAEVMARVAALPFCFDFLPDGRLLVVSGARAAAAPRARRLARDARRPDRASRRRRGTTSSSTPTATPTSAAPASTSPVASSRPA